MSYDPKFEAALRLLTRLDPRSVKSNLESVCRLIQSDNHDNDEIVQDLLSYVDTPLVVAKCPESGKEYLCCDYNRDGDSFRSPWSNQYYPAIPSDEFPPPFLSPLLRQLEVKANESFDIYRELYYEGSGVSSVYLWDSGEDEDENDSNLQNSLKQGFAGVVLIKKESEDGLGKWDSTNVFEVIPNNLSSFMYKVTTSVTLDLQSTGDAAMYLSGSLTRQSEIVQTISVDGASSVETSHLINLGTLIEQAEYNVRNSLQEVYFGRLKDIFLMDVRSVGNVQAKQDEDSLHAKVIQGLTDL